MAVTDQQILEAVQYAVMEPPDLGDTWPSGLWTRDEIVGYLNERQSRFLKTGLFQVGSANTDPGVARQAVFTLPEDWIATVSVVWRSTDLTQIQELVRSDGFEVDHGDPTAPYTESTPLVYQDYETPTLQLRVAPLPDRAGVLEVIYVARGAELGVGLADVPPTAELFTLQDEFVDAAGKYGALADMLAKDGRGQSPEKATYCEGRFQLGLDAAAIILQGRV